VVHTLPAQPGVLEHVLGVGGRAQHPVGDAEQPLALLLELVERRGFRHADILAHDRRVLTETDGPVSPTAGN
jgi:hypothetical protein